MGKMRDENKQIMECNNFNVCKGKKNELFLKHLMNLNTTYLGKSHESGFQEYLRYWLSGLPNFWQSNSSSMKGQLEES